MFKPMRESKTIGALMEKIEETDLFALLNDLRMLQVFKEDEEYMKARYKKYNLSYEAYIDFYILLQCANALALNVEEARDNMDMEDLIYFYGNEHEADTREYQLKKFKEVFKC